MLAQKNVVRYSVNIALGCQKATFKKLGLEQI